MISEIDGASGSSRGGVIEANFKKVMDVLVMNEIVESSGDT